MLVNNISYNVDWQRFKVGSSFFVPCLWLEEGKLNIRDVTKRLGVRVVMKPVIEEGIKEIGRAHV